MKPLIGLLLLLTLLVLSYLVLKPLYQAYLRKRTYLNIMRVVDSGYQHANPYLISKSAKEQQEDDTLTYGEIDTVALLDLLARLKPTSKDVFYDLGSGSGKAVFAAKLRYPQMRAIGIERQSELHDLAEEIRQSMAPPHPDYICDDFLNVDFTDATIILINATAFHGEQWEALLAKLKALKPKTKIIITSKKLPATLFVHCYGAMEKMNWGLCTTHIYEKV
ncbi:MAG: hypothetical protein AB7I18_14675 [Candidatus Berkiella sp.]